MALSLLIYVSKAAVTFSEEELEALLAQARTNNASQNVSGLLIYHDGSFIQALEGDDSVLDQLYATIESDGRHEHTRVLYRGAIEERSFDGWAMGYKRINNLKDIPEGFHSFLQSGFKRAANDDDIARKALLSFKEGRFRSNISA